MWEGLPSMISWNEQFRSRQVTRFLSCFPEENISADPHSPGSALPPSSYAADIGYLVDGTPCLGRADAERVWIQHTTHYSIAVGPADFPRYSLFAKGVPTRFQMHPLQFYVQIIRQFSTTHGPPARENSSILWVGRRRAPGLSRLKLQ